MIVINNPQLADWLRKNRYEALASKPQLEVDDADFTKALREVTEQHPHHDLEEAKNRAVYRVLTHTTTAAHQAAAEGYVKLKEDLDALGWRIKWSLFAIAVFLVIILFAVLAHAEPEPNAVIRENVIHALLLHPPVLAQVQGGSVFARMQFISGGTWTAISSSAPLPMTCISGCSGGGGGGGTSSTFGAAFPSTGTAIGASDGTNMQGLLVDGSGYLKVAQQGSVAVTGTFWQATQPVSGTFWQSTQPVSLATLPALVAGSAVIGHVINDTGSTTAVTGNVTAVQATGSNLHVAVDSAPSTAVTNAGTFAVQATLAAGSAVVGHVIADSGSTTAVTGNVASTVADGANVTLGAKADAKSTATDTTAVTAMQVLKEISAMEQAPASRAVTNAGTFAVQATIGAGAAVIGHVIADSGSTTAVTGNVASTIADGADVTLGAKADAKSTATDTTAVTAMQVLKEISAMEQAPASRAVTNAGTFATQATLAAETTKVIGTVNQGTSPWVNNTSQINGVTPLMGNGTTGTGSQRVTIASDNTAFAVNSTLSAETTKVIGTVREVGNVGGVLDAAIGAAPPANAMLNAGLGSGATGGFLVGVAVADTYAAINISTATTTRIVTGVASRQVRISAQHMVTAAANNVAWIEGTGATCGTATAGMAGGTTAASGYNFAANGGISQGSGFGTVLATVTSGDSVCLVTSASTQLSGGISYTIY